MKKPSRINIDMEKALSEALSTDLGKDLDLDKERSLDDFESQVNEAAKELKKAEHKSTSVLSEKTRAAPMPKPTSTAAFRPANDDNAEREYAQMLARLNSKPSGSPYWVATFVSAVWIGGAAFLAHALYAPGIWQIRSFDALLAIPGALAILVGTIVPILMFFGFAAMIGRAQEMRMTATSMSEIAFRLVAPENIATDQVATVGQAIRREVAAMGEGIERTVARATELEAMMQNEVIKLERGYSDNEVRLRSLLSDLGSEREEIVIHSERLRASISGAHEDLRGELMSAADVIRQNVLSASRQLTTALNQSGDDIVNRMTDSGGAIDKSISERIQEVSGKLMASGETFASMLDARIATLQSDTDSASHMLAAALEARSSSMVSLLGNATSTMTSEFDTRMAEMENLLKERGGALLGEFQTRVEAVNAGTDRLDTALDTRARQLNKALLERTRAIAETLTSGSEVFANQVGEKAAAITSSLSKEFELRAADLTAKLNATSAQIDQQSAGFLARADEKTQAIYGAVKHTTDKLDAGLSEQSGRIEQTITAQAARLDSSLSNQAADMAKKADELAARMNALSQTNAEKVSAETAQFLSRLDEKTQAIYGAVDRTTTRLASAFNDPFDAMEGKSNAMAERLAASAAEMSMLVEQRTTTAIDALNASTRALEDTFKAQSGVVGERTETLEKALALGVDNVRKALEESAGKLASTLRDRVTESRREIEEEANRITALTGDSGNSMTARIEEILRSHQESLTAGIASYEAQISERTAALNDILENTTKPLVDSLTDSGKGLADELGKATKSVTERLRHENTELVNMLATRTADTLTAVEGMQTNLSQGVGELIDRLSSSNSRLGELIELAATNIGSMDKRLDTTTDNFIDKVGGAAENFEKSISLLTTNTARLDDISAKTLSDVASIASRFQEHGNVLATASDLLGSAQKSLTATLEDRSAALDQLASGLVGKSEEVQLLLRSFENVVTSTLQGVEQRALSSTDTMAASIRQTAEDAMARFDEATENMRDIAANMRGELQATRDEVRRGVMALPEETRESANAMRRAVSEQINALKDLSRIVEDSGRAFDINDGTTRVKKPMTSAAATSRASEVAPARSPSPTLSAPTMRGTVDTPPRVTQPASNGWVSDLLKRASQNEIAPRETGANTQTRPARAATGDTLNNISADIARAIDNEAAMDLWERYRRGERNLFNRRLYTLRGQQTFDDMKRRYESDGKFATTVNRYITDFERLLEDVSRNDRDGAMALSYLTSDTGKVYTMLAHASGRLR